jgi:diguanylate cyclase (GGDEF)-like protein/PAS domain S-box-containing protein
MRPGQGLLRSATGKLLVVAVILLAGLAFFLHGELARDRAAAEARLQSELEAQARLAEAAVAERVRKIDTALMFLRRTAEQSGLGEVVRVYENLRSAVLVDMTAGAIVTDARGNALLADDRKPEQPISLADRDFFQRLRDGPDVLVVSDPVVGRVSSQRVIIMARSLRSPNGAFAGVIAVGVKPAALLGSGLPQRSSAAEVLTLMSSEGVVLSRSRDLESFLGKRIDPAAVASLNAADVSYVVRPSPTDGKLRAHALHRVGTMPMHIAVGDTFDGVEAQLAPRRNALVVSTSAVAALMLLLLWQAGRYADRRAQQLQELAALTTRLEQAQEVAGVGHWLWDVAADRLSVSEQVHALLGSSPDMQCPSFAVFSDVVPEDERAALLDAFRVLVKDGSVEHEHHIRRPDNGELRCFRQTARVTERGEDGRALRVIGTCRDITEERRTQALLEARERRLDAIIGSLAEGVVVRDREGRITLVNDAAARLAGMPREALIGQRPEAAAWEMLDEHGRVLAPGEYPAIQTVSSGRPIDHQLFGIRPPGQRLAWVSVSTRLLPPGTDASGDAVVASISDVTRLREAEREGRMAAAVFAQVSQPIVVTDGESRVLRINHAFTEVFGYSVEEAVGQKIGMLRSRRHDAAFYEGMWRQLQQEGLWRGEVWNRRRNGEAAPFLVSITRISEPVSRETRYVAVYADLVDQKRAEEALRWQASHDALTGLPNRQLLADRLQGALVQARRKAGRVAVAYLDLDRFKPVNDNHGHLAGDFLLQVIADRMRGVLRASDTLARLGGDEFVAVLGEVGDANGVRRALAALQAAVCEPVLWEEEALQVGCSIGVAFWPEDGDDGDALLAAADAAMYRAKADGRGRIAFYAEH